MESLLGQEGCHYYEWLKYLHLILILQKCWKEKTLATLEALQKQYEDQEKTFASMCDGIEQIFTRIGPDSIFLQLCFKIEKSESFFTQNKVVIERW